MNNLADPVLALAADILDDLEKVKIANENRLRQMTRSVEDSDGEVRGFGFHESHPDVARLASMVEALGRLEHDATLNLQRQLRKHPLHAWAKSQRGVGEKQAARLLAAIGDPYIRPEWTNKDDVTLPEGPRTVSALWAYCGLHVLPVGDSDHVTGDPQSRTIGVAPRRQRNQQSNWSEIARMRVWNVADKCKVAGFNAKTCTSMAKSDTGIAIHSKGCECGPYRLIYDAARLKYANAVHPIDCVRCGPKGKPALAGSPLSLAHQDARALRAVMKAIIKDLWLAAQEWHTLQSRA